MGSSLLSVRSMSWNSGQLLRFSWNSVLNCAINLQEIQVTALLFMWEYKLPNYNLPTKNKPSLTRGKIFY